MNNVVKTPEPFQLDTRNFESELKKYIRGEVRFDRGALAMYSTDSSNYRMVPVGVVLPKSREDIIESIRIARKYDCPVLSRGGGTSLGGQCCNTALIIDMSKYYHGTLDIDPVKKAGRVLPGTVLDHFIKEANKHGLTFGPDPSTHDHCTIGGMLGNNSCGVHSVLAANHGTGGRVSDNTHEMEILTYDGLVLKVGATSDNELQRIISEGGRRGEIYSQLISLRDKYADYIRTRFPKIPRRISGYNLDDLLPEKGFNVARALVGTESTCVTILESTMLLIPSPKAKSLLVLGYKDVFEAAHCAPEIMKYRPDALEGIDHKLIDMMRKRNIHAEDIKLLPEGNGLLIAEFSGETREEADDKIRLVMHELKKSDHPAAMKLFDKTSEESKLWDVRESGLGASAFVKGQDDTWEGWEDSAVPPEKLGGYLKDLQRLWDNYDYDSTIYGHFGQGCIHCRVNFDLVTQEGIKKWRNFLEEAADLVVSYGGSLSGEHGDGQSKAELIEKMYGPELMEAFKTFKAIWDPRNKMNPGKIVNPYPITSNLRLGANYAPWQPQTHFSFPEDKGSFARAAMRCVGVGKCRRSEGGTMCPSYRVTLEEEHSTRGRAHILFELFHGGILDQRWNSEHVKKALDLCLSCKGCKVDCPVNVDVATYKAEFLSHYYKVNARPLYAYLFGLISTWSRVGGSLPHLSNALINAPGLSKVVKKVLNISPERKLPLFAKESFKNWYRRQKRKSQTGRDVILWADTFNNYFHPDALVAAFEVLVHAGYNVQVIEKNLCCGRPLYDYGMLDTAKKRLNEILYPLKDMIQKRIPIIVLEPSCASVFKDELPSLMPNDETAKVLSDNVIFFSDFLLLHNIKPGELRHDGKIFLHGHCHQKAIMRMDAEFEVLKKANVEFEYVDAGCCGMAGAFGYERDHYDISVKAGEHTLMPAIRRTQDETIIVANGFSCRSQIEHLTGRKAIHIAQLIRKCTLP